MDKPPFNKYIEERYLNQMEYYSKASKKNQKKYKQFQWILIILSALTPVLAALSSVVAIMNLNIVVVVVSSIVAILTTALKTFNYQETWGIYRSTYEKLKPEIYYYDFGVGDYGKPDSDKEALFISRVEAILDTEHTQWPPIKKMQEGQDKSTISSTPGAKNVIDG